MNSEQSISLEKWRLILAFAVGSVVTVVLSTFGPSTWRQIGVLVVALVFWAIQGLSTGAWIILGRRWRQVDRGVRFRYGWSFLATGWGAFVALTFATPIGSVIVGTTLIALAIILTAQAVENRQRKPDERDLFP